MFKMVMIIRVATPSKSYLTTTGIIMTDRRTERPYL